jgi:hypothetical protein
LHRPTPKAPSARHQRWVQALTIAACLGLTFWLGRGSVPPSVSEPLRPGVEDMGSNRAMPLTPASPTDEGQQSGMMKFVVYGADGQPQEMNLPVVNGDVVDPALFLQRSATIPDDVVAAIEAAGHKIERRREFVRQRVGAEHEVVVPIDRVRVIPISQPMY